MFDYIADKFVGLIDSHNYFKRFLAIFVIFTGLILFGYTLSIIVELLLVYVPLWILLYFLIIAFIAFII